MSCAIGVTTGGAVPGDRESVLAFYDLLAEKGGRAFVDTIRQFVATLFREREMPGCHFFTSHGALCISRFPTHEERSGQPLLSVTALAPYRLRFELRFQSGARDEVHREVTERITCPVERGLEQFDGLYARFLAAHDQPNAASGY